jgi:periplasmic protein TonB
MVKAAAYENGLCETGMFAGGLLETSWAQRSRRSLTTVTSFGLQALAIGMLLLIPLLTKVALPAGHALPTPLSWGAPPPPASRIVPRQHATIVQSNLADNVLVAPPVIPAHVQMIEETSPPPQINYDNGPGVPGSTGNGGSGGDVWKSLSDAPPRPSPPPVPVQPARQFRSSILLQGSIIRRVQPVYPILAKNTNIQGAVVLEAIISKAGTIENLQLVSGHPLLVPAAIEAVRQWKYKPYILNGDAIEVETQITVNFTLSVN